MKNSGLFMLSLVISIFMLSQQAQCLENKPLQTYRVFLSNPDDYLVQNTVILLNKALSGYINEVARESVHQQLIKDEQRIIEFLEGKGLIDRTVKPSPKGWGEAKFAVIIAANRNSYQVSVLSLPYGNLYRIPVYNKQPVLIARDIALLLAKLIQVED